MSTLWFIDDETDILELFQEAFEGSIQGYNIKYVTHWDQCKQQPGDIVVHDLNGVGKQNRIKGVEYYTCSGSFMIQVDFPKPFNFELMINTLTKGE